MRQLNIGLLRVIQKYLLTARIDQLFHILHPLDISASEYRNINGLCHLFDPVECHVMLSVSI